MDDGRSTTFGAWQIKLQLLPIINVYPPSVGLAQVHQHDFRLLYGATVIFHFMTEWGRSSSFVAPSFRFYAFPLSLFLPSSTRSLKTCSNKPSTTTEMQQQDDDTHCVEPCDVCGDVGYPEVIATCTKCKVSRAHVYCMEVFLKIVPDDWICEICHYGNYTTSLKYAENKNFSRDAGFDASDITEHENTHSTSPYKMDNSGLQTCSRSQKVGGTGKVKFIPEEEAIRLCGGKVSSKSFPANSSMHKMHVSSKKVSAKVSSMNVKPNSSPSPVGHGKIPRHSGVEKTTITNHQTPHSSSEDRSRECDWRDHSSSFVRPVNKEETSRANALKGDDKASYSTQASSLPVNTAAETLDQQLEKHTEKEPCAASQEGKFSLVVHPGVFCANGECNGSNVDERDLWNIQMNFKLYCCSIPSSHATWKGGFKFQSDALCGLYDGLEAVPPFTVHRKAFYYSCKLPSVLEVKPLPISSLDLFQNDCPGLQDVALYFFPIDNCERSKQDLNNIFEFLDSKNAMLRSTIDGVELLVFTSKQLNEDSQGTIARLNAKIFLWGVFRPKKDGRAIEELTDREAVDMDIDMVGGQDVWGRIDSVQNRKDKPGDFSINSREGMILQKTSEKAKISLPTDLRKNIKEEFPFDQFPLKSVQAYHKIMDTRDAPPGFEGVHELKGSQPLSLKSKRTDSVENREDGPGNFPINSGEGVILQDKPSLTADLKKNIKTEFPFDQFPLKSVQDYHKINAPPGFEGVHELKDSQPLSLKSKSIDSVKNREDRPGNLLINSREGAILKNTSEKSKDKKPLITPSDLNVNVQDKSSSSADLRKKIKVEFPFDKFPLKSIQDYHKIMDTKDAPPGFEGAQEVENLQPPNLKLKRVYDLY